MIRPTVYASLPQLDEPSAEYLADEIVSLVGPGGYEIWSLGRSGASVTASLLPYLEKRALPEEVTGIRANKTTYRLTTPIDSIPHDPKNRVVLVDTMTETGKSFMAAYVGALHSSDELQLEELPIGVVVTDLVGIADVAANRNYQGGLTKTDYLKTERRDLYDALDERWRHALQNLEREPYEFAHPPPHDLETAEPARTLRTRSIDFAYDTLGWLKDTPFVRRLPLLERFLGYQMEVLVRL